MAFSFLLKKESCWNGTAFLTDIEGDSIYMDALLRRLQERNILDDIGALLDGWCIVIGGDMCDKGDDCASLLKIVIDWKLQNPQRVLLIPGNRELNKFRYHNELVPSKSYRPYKNGFSSFYSLTEAARMRYHRWINSHFITPSEWTNSCIDVHMIWVPWMMEEVLGIPLIHQTSRLMQMEITQFAQYLDALKQDISPLHHFNIFQYISLCSPVGILETSDDKRILFVHGGINADNFLLLPTKPPRKSDSLFEWASKYKALFDDNLMKFNYNFFTDLSLDAWYKGLSIDSIITQRAHQVENNEVELSKEFIDYLKYFDTSAIIVGHTPRGPIPASISQDGISFIAADTSNYRSNETIQIMLIAADGELQIIGNFEGKETFMSSKKRGFGKKDEEGYWMRSCTDEMCIKCKGSKKQLLARVHHEIHCKQTERHPQGVGE